MRKSIISTVLALSLVVAPAFAGNPNQSGQSSQSSQSSQVDQCQKPKKSFFKKFKKAVKKSVKKTKKAFKKGYKAGYKAGVKTGDAIQNKVMDGGVKAKKALTGKKCKTFVKGHYKKNGTHTKGHWRKVCKKGCKR